MPHLIRWESTRPLFLLLGFLLSGGFLLACTGPASTRSSESTTPDPGTRIYHVQLQLTDEKERAVEVLGQGQRWWRKQPASARPPLVRGTQSADTAVHIEWKAPFYRVRLGPFATEQQAERVLDAARSAFPDAFVVPDRVDPSS
ncbi:MAG: SPOR domain-containing protein [Bacteroidetes bacterium QH_2_63_10]|nr:MAG: SPOR domain-containing protein [Bacteroidetes bacterium QH_2_63_10]